MEARRRERREMDRQISLEHPEVKGPMRLVVQIQSPVEEASVGPPEVLELELLKRNTTEELIQMLLAERAGGSRDSPAAAAEDFQLFEVAGTKEGETWKERALDPHEYPVSVQLLWPSKAPPGAHYRFVLRRKEAKQPAPSTIEAFLAKFLRQPSDKEYPDLCLLPELTEAALLANLRDRFNSGHIYTYIGPILVAVNPFSFYPIYNPKYAQMYQKRSLGSLPPHIFALADATYQSMMSSRRHQVIVISGESGSGKSESTNFLLHHLTALSQKGSGPLEQTLLAAGPVLEAFGNAQTAQNNNSSRFGKFLKVNYRENGMVSGANVQIYLLEKSRIISQALEERNYHVFYALLSGATEEERAKLGLSPAQAYKYLTNEWEGAAEGRASPADPSADKAALQSLRKSMELVGFSRQCQGQIFSVLSAVLGLGNVELVGRSGTHSDDLAHLASEQQVEHVSRLLQVCPKGLSQALTQRRTVLKTETVVARNTLFTAYATRDAMAKSLYTCLFQFLVLRINQALLKHDSSSLAKGRYIGILDIFGFEDVGAEWNSFEQLCINYANERLQTYFNQHIFQLEQDLYAAEGIAWTRIEYTDNSACVQLLQARPPATPCGLFPLVDEESSIANASDQTLLEKFHKHHQHSLYYEAPAKREPAFIIAHYAGRVKYQIQGFREKNKDLMRQDVVVALKNSGSAFVRELLGQDPVAVFRWAVLRATFRAVSAFRRPSTSASEPGELLYQTAGSSAALAVPPAHPPPIEALLSTSQDSSGNLLSPDSASSPHLRRRNSESQLNALIRGDLSEDSVPSFCDTSVFSTILRHVKRQKSSAKNKEDFRGLRGLAALKALAEGRRGKGSFGGGQGKAPQPPRKAVHTVGAQFQSSLARLMESLGQANPYFIRCIRSNAEKIPLHFDEDIILRQLRYTGMLETVRIRRAGYSVRLSYAEMVSAYRLLLPQGAKATPEDVQHFIQALPQIQSENVQFGHSKVFMREAEKLVLDNQLHQFIVSRVVCLQRGLRTALERRRFVAKRRAAVRLQAWWRGCRARDALLRRSLAALLIQTAWRAHFHRKHYKELKTAMGQFQAACRGFLLRHRFSLRATDNNNIFFPGSQDGSSLESSGGSGAQAIPPVPGDAEDRKEAVGSPGTASDEGILTKESSQEDALENLPSSPSIPRRDSSPSSGILEDSEGEKLTSADETFADVAVTFTLQDTKLKLVGLPAESGSFKAGRRGSLHPLPHSPPQESMAKWHSSEDVTRREAKRAAKPKSRLWGLGALLGRGGASSSDDESSVEGKEKLRTAKSRGKVGRNCQQKIAELEARLEGKKGGSGEGREARGGRSQQSPEEAEGYHPHAHSLKPVRVVKKEPCALCRRHLNGLFALGYKCSDCRLCFHRECLPFSSQFACIPTPTSPTSPSPPHRPFGEGRPRSKPDKEKLRLSSLVEAGAGLVNSWSLNKTAAQVDSSAKILRGPEDLRELSIFIFKKQTEMILSGGRRPYTQVDHVFQQALKEFHTELIAFEAVLKEEDVGIKFCDLTSSFQGSLNKVCLKDGVEVPGTLATNAFRGFLNGYLAERRSFSAVKARTLRTLRQKRRRSEVWVLHMGHRLQPQTLHVPTYCEVCNSFMWYNEHIFVCRSCRISAHKRCRGAIVQPCAEPARPSSGRIFGGDLPGLLDELPNLPDLLDKMMLSLEVKGLFVEGIYRKSASTAQNKHWRAKIEESGGREGDWDSLDFSDCPVHTLAALIKAFFRELSEPLYTFQLYDNFLNIVEIPEPRDRLRCLSSMLEFLPKANRALLDRLMFHLARVAHQAEVNRMGPGNLGLVFGPCLLRRSGPVHAQQELDDVSRQALCVEVLVEQKLRHYRSTLSQILSLEAASETVAQNLRLLHENLPDSALPAHTLFQEQLLFLHQEKDKLLEELPPLAPIASSEEDEVSSAEEVASLASASPWAHGELGLDLSLPPLRPALPHPTKTRPRPPKRRPPTQPHAT